MLSTDKRKKFHESCWEKQLQFLQTLDPLYLSEHHSGSGLVEPSVNQNKVFPVPWIINLNSEQATILVHNNSDDPITLHINQSLGTCTLYTDSPPEATVCIRAVHQKIAAPFCQISLLTYCREVLSSWMVTKPKFYNTCWSGTYDFSKSFENIGRTNLTEYKINTGTSFPIRQPWRKMQLGKRKIKRTNKENDRQKCCWTLKHLMGLEFSPCR